MFARSCRIIAFILSFYVRMKLNNKPAPHSLLYFIKMKENKGKPMDSQAIVKMMAAKMRLPR